MYKVRELTNAKNSRIEYEGDCWVGNNVVFGDNVLVKGKSIYIDDDVVIKSNTEIFGMKIHIGARTRFGGNSKIVAYEELKIGTDCLIRSRAFFKARTIEIGDFFYSNDNFRPLIFGGGGSDYPTAHLKIGKRCVIHDAFINVCMPVTIGDDSALSQEVSIITHGFWNSVLEGFQTKYAGVTIGNACIVGYGATILMGVELGSYVSVAAKAIVTKSFPSNCIIGGVPAKIIKKERAEPMSMTDKREKVKEILGRYAKLLKDKLDEVSVSELGEEKIFTIYGVFKGKQFRIVSDFPYFWHKCRTIILYFGSEKTLPDLPEHYYAINLSDSTWVGEEDEVTDDLRDYLRKDGIRVFSLRWFKSIPNRFKRRLGC